MCSGLGCAAAFAPFHCDFQIALREEMWWALIQVAKEATVQYHGTTLTMALDSVPLHVIGARKLLRDLPGIAGHAMECIAAAHAAVPRKLGTLHTHSNNHTHKSTWARQGVCCYVHLIPTCILPSKWAIRTHPNKNFVNTKRLNAFLRVILGSLYGHLRVIVWSS